MYCGKSRVSTYPLSQAWSVHELMESGCQRGRITGGDAECIVTVLVEFGRPTGMGDDYGFAACHGFNNSATEWFG